MSYEIKTENFEGPLDLLVKLIDEEKLDITRLSLAQVADQYLEYMGRKETVTLESLSQFLSVAAKLILIKSKALLPLLEFTEEEEEEIRDLEYQLEQFKKFKEISKKIGSIVDDKNMSFSREEFSGMQIFFCPPENITADDFKKAFEKVLGGIPAIEKLEKEVMRDVVTLEEKIGQLQETIKNKVEFSFSELVENSKDKIEVVVSFLALLELVKQRIINVEQSELFQDIRMKHEGAINS